MMRGKSRSSRGWLPIGKWCVNLTGGSIGLLLLMGIVACNRSSAPRYSGTVELTEYALGMRVGGRLAQMMTDEGKRVTKGQLLATLERYPQKKRDLQRAEALLSAGGGSQREVEQAQLAVADYSIVAPISGLVMIVHRRVGEVVPVGAPILTVGDDAHPWVKIYIPEGEINRVHQGQKARLYFDGVEKTHSGYVSYIASQAEFTPRNVQTVDERVTQTFAVKVMIEDGGHVHSGVATDVELLSEASP